MSICITAVLTLGVVTADIAVDVDNGPKRQYLKLRTEIDGTAESHAAVAQECQQRKLYDEARAHFFAASRLAQHPKDRFLLRQACGDVRVGDDWLSPRDVERLKQIESDRVRAWKRVGSDVVKLRSTLERPADGPRGLATKAAAREELARIAAGDQSWLVAAVFIDAEPAASRAAVETLAAVPTVASSESLARFAIDSRWSTVRDDACEALRARNPRHYAHVWVERLKTPAVVTHQLADGASRFASVWTYETESAGVRKRYVHSTSVKTQFSRLASDTNEFLAGNVAIMPRDFRGANRVASNRFEYISKRERTRSELRSRDLEQTLSEAAEEIDVDNSRIAGALRNTAWSEVPTDAKADEIWSWWRAYNGLTPRNTSNDS